MLERLTTQKGEIEMRQFSRVVRSRAGLILGSALMTMLLLPVAAVAGGFSGPSGVHHQAAAGSGGSGALAIFLGIIAVAVLSVLILSRIDTNREGGQRAAESIKRKPAGAAS
jgi:hypothetical protein